MTTYTVKGLNAKLPPVQPTRHSTFKPRTIAQSLQRQAQPQRPPQARAAKA